MATSAKATVLDVRPLVPRDRHVLIFERLDALQPDEVLLLVNDHDPRPLYYQLMAERPGVFDWTPEEQGPERWAIRITRQGATPEATGD